MLHFLEVPDKGCTTEGETVKSKAQHRARIKPTTSRVLLCRCVLYHCATAAAQPCQVRLNKKYLEAVIGVLLQNKVIIKIFLRVLPNAIYGLCYNNWHNSHLDFGRGARELTGVQVASLG